jgi:hypothetical protein
MLIIKVYGKEKTAKTKLAQFLYFVLQVILRFKDGNSYTEITDSFEEVKKKLELVN